jgi:hypothetical protein
MAPVDIPAHCSQEQFEVGVIRDHKHSVSNPSPIAKPLNPVPRLPILPLLPIIYPPKIVPVVDPSVHIPIVNQTSFFRVGTWNIRLTDDLKADAVLKCITYYDLDLCVICETWLNPDSARLFTARALAYQYQCYSVCREVQIGGGVVVLVKRCITSALLWTSVQYEYVLVQCTVDSKPVLFFCIYIPPAGSISSTAFHGVRQHLMQQIDQYSVDNDIFILGDLNSHIGNKRTQYFMYQNSVVELERSLASAKEDSRGRSLVEMANLKRLVILNGVFGQSSCPPTFVPANLPDHHTVVDFIISSYTFYRKLDNFKVVSPLDIDPFFAFVPTKPDHTLVTASFAAVVQLTDEKSPLNQLVSRSTWSRSPHSPGEKVKCSFIKRCYKAKCSLSLLRLFARVSFNLLLM